MKLVTSEVMEYVQYAIHATDTPSWLGSVPYNFGESNAGTIKADEWRTLSTVYFPLALLSLWYLDQAKYVPSVAKRLGDVLDHTMHLVAAVTLLCLRNMSEQRAEAYRSHMLKYIENLKKLHPQATHKPKHHLALHLPEWLLSLGPVHSWWTFAFERLIGILQRIPTNQRRGEFLLLFRSLFHLKRKLRGNGVDHAPSLHKSKQSSSLAAKAGLSTACKGGEGALRAALWTRKASRRRVIIRNGGGFRRRPRLDQRCWSQETPIGSPSASTSDSGLESSLASEGG